MIDLSQATVLPGFIDTHTHVFNTRGEMTADQSMLIAVENVRSNLLAGFTASRRHSADCPPYGAVCPRTYRFRGEASFWRVGW